MFGHQSDHQASDQSCQHTGFNNPTMQALHSSPESKTEQVKHRNPITMSQVMPIPISGGNVLAGVISNAPKGDTLFSSHNSYTPKGHTLDKLFVSFRGIITFHPYSKICHFLHSWIRHILS